MNRKYVTVPIEVETFQRDFLQRYAQRRRIRLDRLRKLYRKVRGKNLYRRIFPTKKMVRFVMTASGDSPGDGAKTSRLDVEISAEVQVLEDLRSDLLDAFVEHVTEYFPVGLKFGATANATIPRGRKKERVLMATVEIRQRIHENGSGVLRLFLEDRIEALRKGEW